MLTVTHRPLTYHDYYSLPEVGPRYQLIEGELHMAPAPQNIRDFIRWVVPILQQRVRYPSGYTEGSLREKLFGPGRRLLPSTHPPARQRHRRIHGIQLETQ